MSAPEEELPRSDGRRLWSAVLLAFLVGAAVLSWIVASGNFRVVDARRNPRIDEVFADLQGSESRRMATRFLASESNRALFEFAQPLAVGGTLLACILFFAATRSRPEQGDRLRWMLLAGTLVLSAAAAASVPWFVELGRQIDFVPRDVERTAEVRRFLRTHGIFMVLDLVRVLAMATLIPLLLRAPRATQTG